jgi:hypothetical protein
MRSFHLNVLGVVASCAVGALARTYKITNNCPLAITLYITGQNQGTLAHGATITRTLDENFSSFIFTDANGGNADGSGTTRAGFFGPDDYYYAVADPAVRFNTGVLIQPQAPATNGFCKPYMCDTKACNSVFTSPPTRFPPPSSTPPQLPLNACPGTNIGYNVTFCPSGAFPPDPAPTTLHPNGNKKKCLDVRGNVLKNGTAVQIYDCNGTGAQQWRIHWATTYVQLGFTGFCLDAGRTPASGVGMKIWQCIEALPAQTWFYTADKRIAVLGKGQCLDLTRGSLTNGNRVQTWQCTNGNTNQIWTLGSEK